LLVDSRRNINAFSVGDRSFLKAGSGSTKTAWAASRMTMSLQVADVARDELSCDSKSPLESVSLVKLHSIPIAAFESSGGSPRGQTWEIPSAPSTSKAAEPPKQVRHTRVLIVGHKAQQLHRLEPSGAVVDRSSLVDVGGETLDFLWIFGMKTDVGHKPIFHLGWVRRLNESLNFPIRRIFFIYKSFGIDLGEYPHGVAPVERNLATSISLQARSCHGEISQLAFLGGILHQNYSHYDAEVRRRSQKAW